MDSSDDVPPLEDMTEVLRISTKVKTNSTQIESQPTDRARTTNSQESKVRKDADNFGGLKKGFLTAKSKSKDNSSLASARSQEGPPKSAAKSEIPHLHKKPNSLEIPEVQEAMKNTTPLLASKEWVTDDLLEKIERHPLLSKAFRDPSLSQVLTEFQRNPEAMLMAAQGNKDMMQFLQEFTALMGEHFAALSGNKDQERKKAPETPEEKLTTESRMSSNEEELRFKDLLQKPEIQEVLQDKDVRNLIATLKSNPDQAQKIMQSSNADFKRKVRVLVDNGILGMQQAPV